MPLHQRHGRDHHARRADPALRAATLEEGLLHGVQLRAAGDALNRANVGAIGFSGRNQATGNDRAIQQHGARAAFPLAATFLCARRVQLVAQHVQQPCHGISVKAVSRSVNRARDFDFADSLRH